MSESLEIEPPSFNPSEEDEDLEYFWLRAPAKLDVSKILNGATLDVDSQFLTTSASKLGNGIISRFKAESDGQEYVISLDNGKESDGMRLLVPDYDDEDKLVPFKPLKGQLILTSAVSGYGDNNAGDGSSNIQTDLLLAPAVDRAPKPAFGPTVNGGVDKMRLAYVHVPQRGGLKRRWAMPGSDGNLGQTKSTKESTSKDETRKRSHKKAKKSKA